MSTLNYDRLHQLEDLFRKKISEVILVKVRDKRFKDINIVDVKISSDLLNGKVYFRTLNDSNLPNQKVFEKFASMIRHELASNTDLKRIPKFTFILDTWIENANHIEDLLNLKWEIESS